MPSRRVILILASPPLPFGQAMGRWYYVLLRGLVERGHSVRAFAACGTQEEVERTTELFPSPTYDLRCYTPEPRGWADRVRGWWEPLSYPYGPQMRRDVSAAAAEGFDLIHLDVLWSGYVARPWARRSVVGVPYLYRLDLEDQPAATIRDRLRRQSILRAERSLARAFPNQIAVSPRLARELKAIATESRVHAVPFGMELSLYPFREAPPSRPPTIGFVASFDWTPGVTAGRRLLGRLWPEIRRRVPEARVLLGGRGALGVLGDFVGTPGVEVRDRVDDPLAFFQEIDLVVYPPNPSSGMKFKVLEAFALGVPVVTNAAGVEGIPALDGTHAGIAEDDAGLIDRADRLLRDPEARDRMRRAARGLLEEHCGPQSVLDQVEAVHDEVAFGRPADPGVG
jgi:glycosyltransferase involved in cell wall biosynthesis